MGEGGTTAPPDSFYQKFGDGQKSVFVNRGDGWVRRDGRRAELTCPGLLVRSVAASYAAEPRQELQDRDEQRAPADVRDAGRRDARLRSGRQVGPAAEERKPDHRYGRLSGVATGPIMCTASVDRERMYIE